MYKYLSKNFYNNIIINYNNKTVKIEYLNKDLKRTGSYILNVPYTIYLDNIFNLFFNYNFKKTLNKLNYKISLKVIKDY